MSSETTYQEPSYTPREIVHALDAYIVGQQKAKRAVAIALRNRWRRKNVPQHMRDEIAPKNIILIGATGVGKTEIARRLAKLAQAPFVKVEASKFTEIGYVGRDVDSMIRDLVEASIQLVKQEAKERVLTQAKSKAEEELLDLLLPKPPRFEEASTHTSDNSTREKMRTLLRNGEINHREVEIDTEEKQMPTMQIFSPGGGMDEMGFGIQDMMGQLMGKKTRKRRVKIPEALELLTQEEAQKLIDQDAVVQEGLRRAEQSGIVFLDEIDKIAKREGGGGNGPDVSREGVQRDILPVVEGCTVNTKYGMVKTDHMLFIAAGAFHVSKVSDLIPELQGRFPIRVELDSLGEEELLRILQEPKNALPIQYKALMETEGVVLEFTENGLQAIAQLAATANMKAENIGARRLHSVFERLLEDISFSAPERAQEHIVIDANYVHDAMGELFQDEDLARYIL